MKKKYNDLLLSVDILMSHGGDSRVCLSEQTGVNKYFSRPKPHENLIARSSSTTSFPSLQAFAHVQSLHKKMNNSHGDENSLFSLSMEHVRDRLKKFFDTSPKDFVFTTSGGTSAEMIFSLLALARHEKWSKEYALGRQSLEPLVSNIIVAAEEVGSKSAAAAACCHFSAQAPSGLPTQDGEILKGMGEHAVNVIEVFARDRNTGILKKDEDLETEIELHLKKSIEEKNQIAVLHFVQASKTGITVPRLDFVKKMKEKYGERLIVVVDAAQVRCVDQAIKEYCEHDFCSFVTGSKFFAGVSFCGAVFIPGQQASVFAKEDFYVPQGLSEYFSKDDVDSRLTVLRDKFSVWKNYGGLFRWETALFEMEKFYEIDVDLRDRIIKEWCQGVHDLVQKSDCVSLLSNDYVQQPDTSLMAGCNTIVPISFQVKGEELTVERLRETYKLLLNDISSQLPESASMEEKELAREKILIGQLVKLAIQDDEKIILRIALSAPLVVKMAGSDVQWNPAVQERVKKELVDDQKIINKLALIHKYFDKLVS